MNRPRLLTTEPRGRAARVDRGGVALVEFALVLPVALLLFAGMLQMSRMMMLQHTVDAAAYEGARMAMVPGATSEEAEAVARQLMTDAGFTTFDITIDPPTLTEASSTLTVDIVAPMNSNAWIRGISVFDVDVRSTTTLICERPPAVKMTGLKKINDKKAKKPKKNP